MRQRLTTGVQQLLEATCMQSCHDPQVGGQDREHGFHCSDLPFFFFSLIIARHGDGQFPKFLVRSIYLVTVRDGKFSVNRTWAVTDI